MGKHYDKDGEEGDRRRLGDGQVPPDTWVSLEDPQGRHSEPEPDEPQEGEE
ncbi:MAG: hypothetical protein ACRDRW_10820 [Pseudonocardiaceae bacterium]